MTILSGDKYMNFFEIFHGNINLIIDRSDDLKTVTFYIKRSETEFVNFLERKKEVLKRFYMPGLILSFNCGKWSSEVSEVFEQRLNSMTESKVNLNEFIEFAIDNLTLPEKNNIKIPRFSHTAIESLLEFIKTNKNEADLLLRDVDFFDDISKSRNEYQDSVMNMVMREYFEVSLYNYGIDERLLSERELRQKDIWMLFDCSYFEGFHVMAVKDNGIPRVFMLSSDGDFMETDNILGIIYDMAYYEMDFDDNSTRTLERFNAYKDALQKYDSFMKSKGLNPDPERQYHNADNSLILMRNLADFIENQEQVKPGIEGYTYYLKELSEIPEDTEDRSSEEERIIEKFFPMDC